MEVCLKGTALMCGVRRPVWLTRSPSQTRHYEHDKKQQHRLSKSPSNTPPLPTVSASRIIHGGSRAQCVSVSAASIIKVILSVYSSLNKDRNMSLLLLVQGSQSAQDVPGNHDVYVCLFPLQNFPTSFVNRLSCLPQP